MWEVNWEKLEEEMGGEYDQSTLLYQIIQKKVKIVYLTFFFNCLEAMQEQRSLPST